MPEEKITTGEDISGCTSRKPWRTPQVIVSALSNSEAKGPPTLEANLFFSGTIHTPNS
jgi:hypothetical protein